MSSNEFELGDAIQAYLKEAGIQDKILIENAMADWPRIMGATISSKTTRIWYKEKVLYVQISDPTWRAELGFAKSKIREMMNREMGKELIQEVRII